jgi:Phosphotransferase enzyme family
MPDLTPDLAPHLTPVEAAVALGIEHGIRADDPRVLNDGSNLLVHLRPAPVVVRVATFTARIRRDPLPYLEREVRLASALVAEGAAVAPPSSLMPAGPHVRGGWAMSAWGYVEHEPGAIPDGPTAVTALDFLHEAMRRVSIDLPLLGPATSDLDLAIEFAVANGLLDGSAAIDHRTRRDQLVDELVAAAEDRQPLHGDAFPRNSLVTPAGVVWIDLEDCCWGPAAWDHAVLIRNVEDQRVSDALRRRDGNAAIDAAIGLRTIQADVWRLLHDARAAGRLAPGP